MAAYASPVYNAAGQLQTIDLEGGDYANLPAGFYATPYQAQQATAGGSAPAADTSLVRSDGWNLAAANAVNGYTPGLGQNGTYTAKQIAGGQQYGGAGVQNPILGIGGVAGQQQVQAQAEAAKQAAYQTGLARANETPAIPWQVPAQVAAPKTQSAGQYQQTQMMQPAQGQWQGQGGPSYGFGSPYGYGGGYGGGYGAMPYQNSQLGVYQRTGPTLQQMRSRMNWGIGSSYEQPMGGYGGGYGAQPQRQQQQRSNNLFMR